MDGLADLAQLDEELRRIRRYDQEIGVRLDKDARFAFVNFAEVFAGSDGLIDQGVEVGGLGDARAVGADAAEVGQAAGLRLLKAVDRLSQHEREGVFSGAAGAGQDERVRESARAHTLAQMRDGGRVAEEVLEAHGSSVAAGAGGRRWIVKRE